MLEKPPAAYEILDFVLCHLSFLTVNKVAQIAGVPGSNVRAGLQGQRKMPVEHVRKLAAATGLELLINPNKSLQLLMNNRAVVNLAVTGDELKSVSDLIVPALGRRPPSWKFLFAYDLDGSTYVTAIALIDAGPAPYQRWGYVLAHVSTPVQADLLQDENLPAAVLQATDDAWIRLRAGMQSAADLDLMYKVGAEPQPTALDWAQVLLVAHELGFGPEDVIAAMRNKNADFLASFT